MRLVLRDAQGLGRDRRFTHNFNPIVDAPGHLRSVHAEKHAAA